MKKCLIILFIFYNTMYSEVPLTFSTIGTTLCAGLTAIQLYRTIISYTIYKEAADKNKPLILSSLKPLQGSKQQQADIKEENKLIEEGNESLRQQHEAAKIKPFLQAKKHLFNNSAFLTLGFCCTLICYNSQSISSLLNTLAKKSHFF